MTRMLSTFAILALSLIHISFRVDLNDIDGMVLDEILGIPAAVGMLAGRDRNKSHLSQAGKTLNLARCRNRFLEPARAVLFRIFTPSHRIGKVPSQQRLSLIHI